MRTWKRATAGGRSPGRRETAEQLLDAVEARAQHGLRRSLRNVRTEARGLLEGEFVRRRPWVAIGVTTAVPTLPFRATGRLGAAQLDRLAGLLDELGRAGFFRIVLIHHPPVSKAGRSTALLDAPVLLRIIAAHGADLVLHGHDHLHMIN